MKATVKKWGNSAALRIPSSVMRPYKSIWTMSWTCEKKAAGSSSSHYAANLTIWARS